MMSSVKLSGTGSSSPSVHVIAEERRLANEYLTQTAAELTRRGCTVTTEVRDGLAPRVLVSLTKPGDAIVMASHGRTGLARGFLGSVAEEVVRHANVPVMIIRALPADGKGRPAAPSGVGL